MSDVARKDDIRAGRVTMIAGSGIAYDATKKFGSQHVGKAVMLSAAGTVDLVTDALEIFGKLDKVEPDGFCVVQDEGYMELPTDTTTITYTATNNGLVGGATAGTVRTATVAEVAGAVREAIAVQAGETANTVIARL
jgi:hypothetical protein